MSQQSFHQQTANGSNIAFTITTFSEDEIKVYVDGVESTNGGSSQNDYTIPNYTTTGGTVTWNTSGSLTAPASPSVVRIIRQTDVMNNGNNAVEGKAVFQAGSSVKANDLNNNTKQALRAIKENQEQLIQSYDFEPQAVNTAAIKDGAVNSAKILDGTIVNADVNASAAIAGTKINPDFGSQTIATTGDLGVGGNTAITGYLDVDGTADIAGNLDCHAGVDVTGNITVTGTVDGRDVAADGAKIDGIESSATADQTAAEIRTLVESATDSNVFTDADHTKLNNIETGATADQTNAEIRAAVEAASDSNVFTDADHSKLNGIEAGATGDQTNDEIRAAVEAASDSNVFTDADHTKLNGIATGAEVNVNADWNSSSGDSQILNKPTLVTALNGLSDVNTSGVADGKILKYDASASEFIIADDGGSGSGGATAFTGLSDTPANYGSAANKTLKVNSSGNAIEFVDVTTSFVGLSDTPSSLSGQGGKTVKVNSGGSALEFETVVTDLVSDTTPQLGGNLDVQASEINTSTTNGNIKLTPNGTGFLEVKGNTNPGTIQLNCENNSHGVKIKSPAHSASATYTLTLPTGISNGQFLTTDANGVLSWGSVLSSSGGTLSGPLYAFGGIELGNADTIKFDSDDSDANHISFRGPDALSSTVTYTLPEDGTAGQVLTTDGSGVLSFATNDTDKIVEGNAKVEVKRTSDSPSAGDQVDEIEFTVSKTDASGSSTVTQVVGNVDSHGRWFLGPNSGGKASQPNGLNDGMGVVISGAFDYADQVSGSLSNYGVLHLNNKTPGGATALGKIYFSGYGNAFEGASIIGVPTGAWGNFPNYRDTDITINLNGYSTNSTTTEVERFRFKSTGALAVNGASNYGTAGQVLTSQGNNPPTWTDTSGTVAGGAIYENSQTISASHTIPSGSNGMSAGPVTVNNGITLTISNGSTYTIV